MKKINLYIVVAFLLIFAFGTKALASFSFSSSAITGTGATNIDVGIVYLSGSTSGKVTIQPGAIAGTYALTLPADDGTASQYLQTNGSGVLSWATVAGGAQTPWTSNIDAATYSLSGLSDIGLSGTSSIITFSGAGDSTIDFGHDSNILIYDYSGDDSLNFETNSGNMTMLSTGLVGIGTYGPTQRLEVKGGLRLNTVTAKPACDASLTRGTFWVVKGGTGVADTVEVCSKDGSDAYAWRTVI